MDKITTKHYIGKRASLKKYICLKRKLSRTKETSKKYQPLRRKMFEEKRLFYDEKIDTILGNWSNYEYCPGRRWYRAVTGLARTMDELRK